MRILHTSDWHVGKTLYRKRRTEEEREVLAEIVSIAEREAVDTVLVCGDIFDRVAPTAESETVVFDALLALEKRKIPVLLLPGNHDHPRRWGALEPLLRRFAVRVVPEIRRPEAGGIVSLPARDNSAELQIAALPWVFESRLFGAREVMGLPGQTAIQSYADEMARVIEVLCEPLDPSACTVFAGHLFVSGSRPGEAQRVLTMGQVYAVEPQALPEVQYAALGHVHRPQRVQGAVRPAYYSGSPLQLNFGEVDQKKSVNIVDLQPGIPAEVRTVALMGGRRLRDVSGTLEELEAMRDALGDDYLKVTLRCGGWSPGLGDQVRELLPNALEVEVMRLGSSSEQTQREARIRGLTAREQYAHYLRAREGAEPAEDELNLFESLLAEVAR